MFSWGSRVQGKGSGFWYSGSLRNVGCECEPERVCNEVFHGWSLANVFMGIQVSG